jgi:sRNA-binding protein
MNKQAKHVMNRAVIKMLCDRFPQTFSLEGRRRRPLKLGVHADALAALDGAVSARDLHSAMRAYTSAASYLRTLSAGACRIDLDGKPFGAVTGEEEAVAKGRLADLAKRTPPTVKAASPPPALEIRVKVGSITAAPKTMAVAPKAMATAPKSVPSVSETEAPAAPSMPSQSMPKRLSLADLREAGRRRREAAA